MKKGIYAIILLLIAATNVAAVKQTADKYRDAFSPITALEPGDDTELTGTSDGKEVQAIISLDYRSAITEIAVEAGGRPLGLPQSSYNGLGRAQQAWLEERGALTTLVIEGREIRGENRGKEWRLALLFHSKQLWRRRFSIEGQDKDQMTFYRRDERMEPTEIAHRNVWSRGFHDD